jgi:hypothetical protein
VVLYRKGKQMKDIMIKLLEDTQDKLSGRDIVLQLSAPEVTDYERGKVQGKIEMLTYLMRELVGDEDEA